MAQRPKFDLWEKIEKGAVRGLENVRKELKKELYLSTPVDTGYLRDGENFGSGGGNEITRKGLSLTIKNEAHYAPYVYNDTKQRDGRIRKGRPWIEDAIEKVNPTKIVQEAVNAELSRKG